MHVFVIGFDALDCRLFDVTNDILAAFQYRGETLTVFADFFSGHVGGGGQQGARVFGERAQVITGCLYSFFRLFTESCG